MGVKERLTCSNLPGGLTLDEAIRKVGIASNKSLNTVIMNIKAALVENLDYLQWTDVEKATAF